MIKDLSNNTIELITDSFTTTPFTKRIISTNWHPKVESMVTLRMQDSLITQEKVDQLINDLLDQQ